jgi:hypothetical protein
MNVTRKDYEEGLKVEKEHKATYEYLKKYVASHKQMPPEADFYLRIASDHLYEDPEYYTKLKTLKL